MSITPIGMAKLYSLERDVSSSPKPKQYGSLVTLIKVKEKEKANGVSAMQRIASVTSLQTER